VDRLASLNLIEELDHLSSPELVVKLLARTVGQFGIDAILVNTDSRRGTHSLVLETGLPEELTALFRTRNFRQFSPIARIVRHSFTPVLWTKETWINDSDPRAREVMQVAAHCGIHEGCVIPVRGPHGLEADVSLAGFKVDIPRQCVPVVHLLAYYGFARLQKLLALPLRPRRELTPRDRDVLAWSAQGKSTAEIAEIMGIAARTVEEHVRHACRRLEALSRTQAVAIAVRDGLIDVDAIGGAAAAK
jgi:LuxR family quorum sensing-dependent transcriptional regulator